MGILLSKGEALCTFYMRVSKIGMEVKLIKNTQTILKKVLFLFGVEEESFKNIRKQSILLIRVNML